MLHLSNKNVKRKSNLESSIYIIGFIAFVIIGMWLRNANFK